MLIKRKALMKKILSAALACTLLFGAAPAMKVEAVDAGTAILRGIDVSKYNGSIDWNQVAASGVTFAFIKVGSTYSGIDPCFDANIRGAQAAGLKTGVYIYSYATSVEAAINEANLVLSWINNYTINYPVVIDIEDSCHKSLSQDALAAIANAFCQTIEAAGYYPMVYGSKSWLTSRIGGFGYDKWVAQYGNECTYTGGPISFWQATSNGAVPGVPGRVDINYQYKDYSGLIIDTGFLQRGQFTYFYSGYKMQRGWIDFNDTRYYANELGQIVGSQWFSDENGTYYLTGDGQIARGLYPVDNMVYYFDGLGRKCTGWITIGEEKRYFNAANNGIMLSGWFSDETGTYYLDPADGHAVVGEQTIDGERFYFDAESLRQVGWVNLGTGQYYYDPARNGAMHYGWLPLGEEVYYQAPENGATVTGTRTIDGKDYYFGTDGVMQSGWQTIDDGIYYYDPATGARVTKAFIQTEDKCYYVGADGAAVKGFFTVGENTYYADDNCIVRTGFIQIGEPYYYFAENGVMQKNMVIVIGETSYSLDENGVATEIVPEESVTETQEELPLGQ